MESRVPWTFSSCLGQSEAVGRLVREAETGRMAHAYMLEGAQGLGKLTLAQALTAFALCENRENRDACGHCRSCRLLANGNHPDYLELPRDTPELLLNRFVERQTPGDNTGVQPLLPFLRLKPMEGKLRVAVVPDAERMRAEAANAFLKTLEEPPGNSLLILTVANRDRLPATISSRCRRLGLRPLPTDMITEELSRKNVADAAEVAIVAEGSLGSALRLADAETAAFWRWLDGSAFEKPGATAAKELADRMISHGSAGGDNSSKRVKALAALDLTALALRRRLRREDGVRPERTAKALASLWTAADQIVKNVRPDLVLLSASFEVMAALKNP